MGNSELVESYPQFHQPGYTLDESEDISFLQKNICIILKLLPVRKKNSKRPLEPWEYGLQFQYRQQVETTGSLIERKLPKSIHATNAKGFELKVKLFVISLSIDQVLK